MKGFMMKQLNNNDKFHFRIPLVSEINLEDFANIVIIFQEYGVKLVELDPEYEYIEVIATEYDMALAYENTFMEMEFDVEDWKV
jgi:hypothetical protein